MTSVAATGTSARDTGATANVPPPVDKPAAPRRVSLQSKILSLVALVTFVLLSTIIGFSSYSLQRSVNETYIGQLNGITTAINGRYEESHSVEDVQQIFDYIQYKNPQVLQLTLFGEREILASTDRERIGLPSPPDLLERLKTDSAFVVRTHEEKDGSPRALLTAELKEDGITIGAIELLLDTSDSSRLIRERIAVIVYVGFSVALAMLIALSLIIRRLLIRPLLALRDASLTFKQGLPYKDIATGASQEIDDVASAFNEMVHNLEGRYAELEQALTTIRETQKQLVESEKMVALGNLVAGVSHEINTPIGIGVTAVSFLQEKVKEFKPLYEQNRMKRSDLDDYLRTVEETSGMIQANLQRASELIRSFKQVAVDRSSQTKRRFKVKAYIQEVLVSLRPNLKKTKHRLTVEGPDAIELYSDPGAVSQLITNLLMNSLIHAYGPDSEGTISIQLERQRHQLTIRYSDDGRGMSQETVEQIYNPFFTTNRGGGGTGLGMHIVYNLVTQSLEGTIQCRSEPGGGTVFTIQIPITEE